MTAPMEEILAGGWTTPETNDAATLSDQAQAASTAKAPVEGGRRVYNRINVSFAD